MNRVMDEDLKLTMAMDDFMKLDEILHKYRGAGGNLHIVTDDYNIDNHHLRFCVECIEECEKDPLWLKHLQYAMIDLLYIYPEGSDERESVLMGLEVHNE